MTRFFIPLPSNGALVGPDTCAKIWPCGCEIKALDDGVHISTCEDEDHQWAHRETCLLMAKRWKSEVIES